ARLQRVVEAFERDAARRADGRELFAPQPLPAAVGDLPRLAVVPDDASELARRGRLVEAEHLDRIARRGTLTPLALVVEQRLDAPVRVAGDDRVADLEGAALHE